MQKLKARSSGSVAGVVQTMPILIAVAGFLKRLIILSFLSFSWQDSPTAL